MKKNLLLDLPMLLSVYSLSLFVNVSVGGTLTHFAAPPVLIVANAWDWGIVHMASNFGWKAALGILTANTVYFFIFRSEFKKMEPHKDSDIPERVPLVITAVHILFIVWTVLTGHYIPLFVGGFLFFLFYAQEKFLQRDVREHDKLESY